MPPTTFTICGLNLSGYGTYFLMGKKLKICWNQRNPKIMFQFCLNLLLTASFFQYKIKYVFGHKWPGSGWVGSCKNSALFVKFFACVLGKSLKTAYGMYSL